MDDIRSRVAYLQGLAEGLRIDNSSAEGRVLSSVIDVMGEVAEQLSSIAEAQHDLSDYVEDLDYDLGALEGSYYADEEDTIRFIPASELEGVEDEEIEFVHEGVMAPDQGDAHHTHTD